MTDLSPKTFTFEQLQAPSAPPAGGQSFSFEELQGAAPKTFSFDELKGAPAALPPGQVKRGTPYAGSYMENLGQQFQAGLHDLAASGAAEVTTSSESYLRAIDKIDQLLTPPKRVDETVNSANDRQDAALNYAGEWMDNPDIALYARDPSQREAIRKKIEGGITAGVSGIVEQQQASSAIPQNPELEAAMKTGSTWEVFKAVVKNPSIALDVAVRSSPQNPELEAAMKTGSTWEVFKAVVKNPSIALDVAVRSSPQMAAGIALTPLVGPMVGAGTASFLSETSSDFVSALQDAGINTKDKAAFEKAIHDPVLVAKAKELALKKGVPVALFDAISGKLAGKMIAPAKVAGKELGPLTREVANIAVQAPVQAGLGAAGEAIGQMAQTQGKVRDPIGVLLEAVGEFGGTVGEVPGMALATGRHFGGEKLPSPDEGAPLSEHGIATIMQGQGQVPPAGTQPPTGTPGTPPPATGTEEHFVPKTVEELPLTRKEFKSWVLQGVSKEASSLAMAALLKREAAKKMLEKGDTMSAERLRNAAAADLKGAIELGFKMKPKPAAGTATGTETGTGVVPPVPPVAPPQTPPTTPPGAPGTPPVTPGTPPAPTPPPAPPTTVAPPTGPVAPVNPPVTPGTPPTVVEPGPTLPQGTPRKYYRTVDPTLGLPHVTNPLFRGQVFSMSKRELKATGDVESFAASHYPSLDPHVAHMKIYQINYDRDIIKLLQEAGFNTDGYEQWTDARIKDAAQALENYARNKGYSVIDFYHFLGDKGKHPLMDKMSQGKNIGIMLNKSFEPFVSRMSEKARGKSLLGGFLFDMSSRIASGISMWYGRPLLIEDFGEAHLFRVDPDINMLSVDMMLEAANKIIKAFMPKARVMLSVSNADKTPGKGDNAYGTFFGVEDGTVNIWMNPKYMNDEFNWRQTFLHEMGHAIAWYNFWDAGSAMQEMLLDAYQKFVLETETDVASAYLKVTNLKRMGQLIATIENGKPILSGASLSSLQDTFSGWFDFDEWMAEGFSRWASSNEKPLTMLDKFFKSVADEIKKVLKLFGYEGVSAADPALTKFFESVQEKHAMGWPSSSPSAVLHGTLEGLKQSVAESGEYLGPDGPTPSPATIGMRKLSRDVISTADIAGVDKFNWWIKSAWGLLQIASKNQHIAGLQKFVQHMRAFHISKMEMVSRADFRLREWRKLGKEMATNLSKFMYAMDTMEYLPVGANMRWPTQAEFAALAAQYRLNARALALYDKMKGDFAHVLDRIEAAWLRDASATISDPIKLQQEINKIVKEMASMRSRPYFPHERFGDWTLTARVNGKVEFHQQFASRKQAEQAAVAYQRSNPGHEVTTGKLSSEGQQFRGLPPSLLKSIASRLSLTAQQRQALDDVILSLAPSNSAAKRFKRRSNTPGYSLDGMRSYATYFMTMSGHVARLEYNGVMTEDIKDVFASAKAMRGVFAAQGVSKRVGIAEWMQRLYDYMNSAKSEWQGLRSFAFIWYLGYNVSSALTNLTQVPMVALPYLSARFGDLKTVNELRKAYTDLNGVYRMKSGALKPELEDALKEAIKQGFIDESMAKELASAANGGTLIEALPGTSAQRALTGFSNVGAIPFQMIEKLNRRVTFVSAFRMAQQAQLTPGTGAGTTRYLAELARANDQLLRALTGQGWTQANAVAFLAGRDAVERSQFEYTKWARPAFMRGKLGTLFTFFMFKQNMLWFLKNSPGAGRAWLMLLAGAGVMGLPGAGDLDDLIKFLAYKLFGKDFDPKVEFRKYVQSLGADPDLVMHGLGYKTLGLQPLGDALGIPVPGIDLSSRIGMGEVIPGMHEATAVNSDSFEEKLGKVAEQLVGPAYGVPLTLLRAQSSQDPNEFKNLERQLPTAFKNLVRAYRYATEGETNRGGAQTTGFDMTDTKARMEVMAQALGFTPARVAARREASQAAYEATEYWALRRNEIFVQYAYAIRTKDREALARVRESLRDFNREAPMPKMRISVKDLLSSLKRRAKEKMKTERGLETPISRDMNKLYPLASPPPSN